MISFFFFFCNINESIPESYPRIKITQITPIQVIQAFSSLFLNFSFFFSFFFFFFGETLMTRREKNEIHDQIVSPKIHT